MWCTGAVIVTSLAFASAAEVSCGKQHHLLRVGLLILWV